MRPSWIIAVPLLLASHAAWVQTPENSAATAVAKAETGPDDAAVIAKLEASVPQPKPVDVASIDAIMVAIYESISGPAGDRNLDRFRSLLLPSGRLTSSIVDEHGLHAVRQWSVDEFVAEVRPVFATNAFYEAALVNRVQRFGAESHAALSAAIVSVKVANAFKVSRSLNGLLQRRRFRAGRLLERGVAQAWSHVVLG